ncbi:hypothetical protein N328_11468, partial [Gavia stellata]
SQPSIANWICSERPKVTTVAWHCEKAAGLRTLGCQLCILHSCSVSAESNPQSWFRDLAKVHCGTMSFFTAHSAYKG